MSRKCCSLHLLPQFWEELDAGKELAQGKSIADSAKAAGLEHVVFSSLEDTRQLNKDGKLAQGEPLAPLSDPEGEAWVVPHFDAKGAIRAHMLDIGLPATFVQLSCYPDNLLGGLKPQVQEDGSRALAIPMADKATGWVAVADTGGSVLTILKDREAHLGKTYGLAGDNITTEELTATLSEVTGQTFKYAPVPMEVFAGFGFPGADDMARMFGALYCVPEHCPRDPEQTRKLNPATQSVRQWAEANKEALLA